MALKPKTTEPYHHFIMSDEWIPRVHLPEKMTAKEGALGYSTVVAEIGVGTGRVLSELAQKYPDVFFVGVDLFYKPLNRAAKKLYRAGVSNALLLRFNAVQPALIFPDHFLDGIIVNFPDPWPKKRHARHRIFYGPIAQHLKLILKPGGWVFLQTDQDFYFQDAKTLLQNGGFRVAESQQPAIWSEETKSGFQMLFERKGEPYFRLVAHG